MLLDVTVSNYQCFAAESSLSFVSPSLRTQTPGPGRTWVDVTSRVAAVFGANASGKSTLLSAVSLLARAIADPGVFLYCPHASSASVEEPTTYDVNFTVGKVRYHYEVEAMAWGIRREALHAYPEGRRRRFFVREQAGSDSPITLRTGSSLKGATPEVRKLLTPGDLMLALAARYRHVTLQPIARGLRLGASISVMAHSDDDQRARLQWLMSRMIEATERWSGIVDALAHAADLGVTSVRVEEKQIPPNILERMRAILAAGSGDEPTEIPQDAIAPVARSLVFTHTGREGESFELPLSAQSDGTIAWLAVAAPAVEALRRGGLLIVDELDTSLHPVLTATLVTMFKDPDINRTGAQILFSSHDTSLLGNAPSRLLDPGEVWFCEKDDAGRSEIVPLAAYDTRPGNNEQKRYLTGKFGALPRVDFSRFFSVMSDLDGLE
ncbi:ATP-binding protein [Propionibacterium australiense]|uniref:ATP-binding protein n=2 Tax=Propionibacterium australiense TaxID=119981 RepID=A0A8B3FS37_9ACTN|nr:ATP-binding protein [Propionibacterium australiense]RLP09076.1 ATP-binding protein [Propionibacterium australiense]